MQEEVDQEEVASLGSLHSCTKEANKVMILILTVFSDVLHFVLFSLELPYLSAELYALTSHIQLQSWPWSASPELSSG